MVNGRTMIHLRVTRGGRVETRTSWNLIGKRTNRFGFSFSIGSSSSFATSLVSVTGGSSGRPTRGTALSSELLEMAGVAVKSIFLTGDSILRFSRALAAYKEALSVYSCDRTCRGKRFSPASKACLAQVQLLPPLRMCVIEEDV